MSKVFLSYSREDSLFVNELHRRLQRDGVECFYDVESIVWGENWVRELEKGVDEADFVVTVLTPAFLASKWTERERTGAMLKRPDRIRPLLRVACEAPAFLKATQPIDVTSDAKFEEQYPRICRDLGGTLRLDVLPTQRTSLPAVVQLPPRYRMLYRSLGPGFAGRVAELWALNDALTQTGVAVIVGTGGLGKTQLATEYVHRFAGFYPGGVFWTDSDRGLAVVVDQIAGSADITLDGKLAVQEQRQQLFRQLAASPTLLVFDNFPEGGSFTDWLPASGNIRVLVTTRRRDLHRYSQLSISPLDAADGIALLNNGPRRFGPEAIPLIEALGGLPLALELVRNYLNNHGHRTVAQVLQQIQQLGHMATLAGFERSYGDLLPTGHAKEISATFQLSWDLASPDAQRLLQLMALLAPVSIPRFFLRRTLGAKATDAGDAADFWVDELARLSLVELDEASDPRVHRLMAAFVTTQIAADAPLHALTIESLAREMERVRDEQDVVAYRELERLLPHAELLAAQPWVEGGKVVNILGDAEWQHQRQGRYRLSASLARKALHLAEQTFDAGAASIATRQSNLALVLQDLGELTEARDLLRAALASAQQSFESDNPRIAVRQSNLALVLKDLGELTEARDLLRAALASQQQSFDPGHPSIARCQSNLAAVMKDLWDLAEARDLLRSALASNQQSFEPGHPSIAVSQSNLAMVLQGLGELTEARELMRAALASDQRSFEAGHPSIAGRQSNLALVLKDLGELAEARDLMRAALASNQRSFEAGHPSIALRQSNLALVLKDLGELTEARDLLRKALDSDEQSFEPGHPSIARCQCNLAMVLKDMGEFTEARELLIKAHGSWQTKLGNDHSWTKAARQNLGSVERELQR
jgi:tetratricopeptide (TPR) repeat protein